MFCSVGGVALPKICGLNITCPFVGIGRRDKDGMNKFSSEMLAFEPKCNYLNTQVSTIHILKVETLLLPTSAILLSPSQ